MLRYFSIKVNEDGYILPESRAASMAIKNLNLTESGCWLHSPANGCQNHDFFSN